jgi:hypothetical protein
VCAPGKTDRPASDRVKTDKRDAIRLARPLAAGELVLVTMREEQRASGLDLIVGRREVAAPWIPTTPNSIGGSPAPPLAQRLRKQQGDPRSPARAVARSRRVRAIQQSVGRAGTIAGRPERPPGRNGRGRPHL